ncbi:MAG: hypothetical protein Q8K63_05395 [Acidimicrobiales bacterium]|nr:hypothetical protein [Acidimicrobiales bacterium]
MRRLLVLVCAIVFVATGASAAAQESGGSISIRLLDAPTNRADDPRAKTYIVDHVSPGTTISRRVEIGN